MLPQKRLKSAFKFDRPLKKIYRRKMSISKRNEEKGKKTKTANRQKQNKKTNIFNKRIEIRIQNIVVVNYIFKSHITANILGRHLI